MKSDDVIWVLCATDENYAPYGGIMLTSLFENNRDCRFNVFVFIDGDFSDVNRKKYYELGKKYGNSIDMIEIDNSMIEGFPILSEQITRPTYYRLLAVDLLPEYIDRIIYFDCDIIVRNSIRALWQVDLTGKAVAGVNDCYGGQCERLGYDSSCGYFNAGVIVCNLDYWRKNRVKERLFEYIQMNRIDHSKLLFMDQDALNAVLLDNKVLLPERFNFQVKLFMKFYWKEYSEIERKRFVEECNKASVIHFLGEKPWNYRSYGGPFFSEWEKYRRKSLWRNCRDIKPLKKYVKHMVKRYLFPGLFRKQHPEWVLTDETKCYYH